MQSHSNWKQLKRGPPEHEELLQQMFGGIVVDGSSACAPREAFERTEEEGLAVEQHGDDSETYASPHTSAYVSKRSLLNRGTASSSTSPLKKSKNQMVKVMQKIHATLENNCNIANKVMLGEHLEEQIKEVQSMASRCGAREGSAEHFMATQLFRKPENRATFKAFETDEGRLLWSKSIPWLKSEVAVLTLICKQQQQLPDKAIACFLSQPTNDSPVVGTTNSGEQTPKITKDFIVFA
jgi:hypothetical protein